MLESSMSLLGRVERVRRVRVNPGAHDYDYRRSFEHFSFIQQHDGTLISRKILFS